MKTTVAATVIGLALLPTASRAGDREVVSAFLASPAAVALSTVEARWHSARHHGYHGHHPRHGRRPHAPRMSRAGVAHAFRTGWAGVAHDIHAGPGRVAYAGVQPGIVEMVTRSAVSHGLPVALAHGIVRAESGYRCSAYNHGAQGIMQIKDASARSVGVSGGLRSCARGLEAGMRYLHLAYVAAHGNPSLAATLYNQGLAARPAASSYSRSVIRLSRI